MNFGEKLQHLRKANGLSQEQLAEQVTVSRQAVSKWELGTAMPDTDNILQISRLFGVTTDCLLNDRLEIKALPEDMNPKQTDCIHENANEAPPPQPPARGKRPIARLILIVLAIYMLAFAAAVMIRPTAMPLFAMIATALSIAVFAIGNKDDK